MDVSELIRNEDFVTCKERGNLWIAINNSVYNIGDFLNRHPGGEEVLLEVVGKDATEAFEDVGHSSDAKELLKKFKIGEVVNSETELKEKISFTSESDETILKIVFSILKYFMMTVFIVCFVIFCYECLDVMLDY